MNAHYLVAGVGANLLEVLLDGLALRFTGVVVEVATDGLVVPARGNSPPINRRVEIYKFDRCMRDIGVEAVEDLQKARHDGRLFAKIALSLREPPCTLLEGDLRHLLLAPQRVRAHVPVTVC